ncbi:hypothetical protein GIB67_018896, partial [Kingdonia uniflora]
MFLFLCAEIGVTPLDFQMLTSLSIARYPTQVSYDDAYSILSNARQLLLNNESNNIKGGNVIISYLWTYLTIAADREDDITIARAFIFFMMGYLWSQMANDTVLLGYLAAVADLDEVAAVTTGGTIIEFSQLLEMTYGLRRSCPVRGCHFKSQMEIVSITWGIDVGGSLLALQFVIGEECETYTSYWVDQTGEVGHLLTDSQRMGNIDLFEPSTLRAESARDAQRLQELTNKNATLRRHLESVDDQLYVHNLHLRKGCDVRVVPLPLGGCVKMRRVLNFRVHPELDMNSIPQLIEVELSE